MADERDTQRPAGAPGASLPPPERLSVYTFASRYHALMLPLWLCVVALALVLLHLAMMSLFISRLGLPKDQQISWHLVSVFDLDSEESLGTYFSVVTLLFIGRLLWHEAHRSRRAGEVWCLWWFALSILFHLLSLEELVDGHEVLETYQDGLAGDAVRPWQVEAFWAAMLLGAAFVPFLWHVGWRFALFAVVGGAIYVLASLGLDLWEAQPGLYVAGDDYHLWTALEEGLELVAPLVFLHGFLAWIAGRPTGTVTERTEITV